MMAQINAAAPRLHLVAGDMSYADTSGQGGPGDSFVPGLWDRWLQQLGSMTTPIPWMCVMGNHEMEPGYDLHGYAGVLARLPMGGRSPLTVPVATTFTIGNVGFIGLDSNDVSYEIPANRGWTGGAQTTWLQQTLAELRRTGSGVDFVVVFMHHAPYSTSSAHGSEGGVREAWVPLFDQYSVDLVISGHNHSYERTLPLRHGAVTTDSRTLVDSSAGTTYVTAGGGGQLATPGFHAGYALVAESGGHVQHTENWSIPTRTAEYALLCVDVSPAYAGASPTMRLRTITQSGAVIDDVELRRPSPVAGDGSDPAGHIWLGAGGVAGLGVLGAGGLWWKHRHDRLTVDPDVTP